MSWLISVDCKENVNDLYLQDQLDCDCPQACFDKTYMTTASGSQWPSEPYKVCHCMGMSC